MSTEKYCPIPRNGQISLCMKDKCALWRGNDEKNGICAISDIAGWLSELFKIANKPRPQIKIKQEPSKSQVTDIEVDEENKNE